MPTTQIYDAHGSRIDPATITYCTNCGQMIKHVYHWQGQPYGSTCIEYVTGIKKDFHVIKQTEQGQKFDLEASQARQAEHEARVARQAAILEEQQAQWETNRATNRVKYAELINVLSEASRGRDFCHDMAQKISESHLTELSPEGKIGILSPRQFQIVREIWGKQTGGRKNSKAYKAAVKQFDEKFT